MFVCSMNCKYKSEFCQDSGSMPGDFMTTKKQAVSPHDSGDLSGHFPNFILQARKGGNMRGCEQG